MGLPLQILEIVPTLVEYKIVFNILKIWKTVLIKDDFTGRQTKSKMSSVEDDLNGRLPP